MSYNQIQSDHYCKSSSFFKLSIQNQNQSSNNYQSEQKV